jgi:glycosyltransferase involved in cell wall biosynthesis
MRISIFTPTHNARFLDDCYRSLAAQTVSDWEWVVLLNKGAKEWRPPVADDRVVVARAGNVRGVGAAKRAACARCSGDVLVELDHDDLLAPGGLAAVRDAFAADDGASLVYSDWTQVNKDLSRNDDRYSEDSGWSYREAEISGSSYLCCRSMAPYPHNVGYIWYAPNHVRAFLRSAYEKVGGYDEQLQVLDDHDLMIRLFLLGDFKHIDACLYLQRMHGANTQVEPRTNAFIQAETVRYYQLHIGPMAAAWARRQGLRVVTLRTATSPEVPDEDAGDVLVIDGSSPRLALEEGSVGLIKAGELLQRVRDRVTLFNECYRVLAHGGLVLTTTPSTDGRGAFQNPSHVSYWNENSFWYLTQSALRPSVPGLTARLQVSHLRTYFPTPWHEENVIPYVQANLLAVKDGPRLGGPLLC